MGMTPLPDNKISSGIIAHRAPNKILKKSSLSSFVLLSTVLQTPFSNNSEPSRELTILITSSISSLNITSVAVSEPQVPGHSIVLYFSSIADAAAVSPSGIFWLTAGVHFSSTGNQFSLMVKEV